MSTNLTKKTQTSRRSTIQDLINWVRDRNRAPQIRHDHEWHPNHDGYHSCTCGADRDRESHTIWFPNGDRLQRDGTYIRLSLVDAG